MNIDRLFHALNPDIDRLLQVVVSIALGIASLALVGLTSFNAAFIFVSADAAPRTSGLVEWYSFAQNHKAQLADHLQLGAAPGWIFTVVIFAAPALAVLGPKRGERLRWALVAIHAILVLIDLVEFLSFPVGNGGDYQYDSSYNFAPHMLLACACIPFALFCAADRLVRGVVHWYSQP